MNEQRIREIASQCSAIAVEIPFFRGIENGLTWEATIQKARDLKFAELVVRECGVALSPMLRDMVSRGQAFDLIKQHFGIEE